MLDQTHHEMAVAEAKKLTTIKCVVWDLDNTVWEGVLLEGDALKLRPEVVQIIKTLDERGILNAIASRNEHEPAMAQLQQFGIDHYFIYPQINWNPKSQSIAQIAADINIGIDTLAFVDDQPFEREEVTLYASRRFVLRCGRIEQPINASTPNAPICDGRIEAATANVPKRHPARSTAESDFTGNNEQFLANLNMVFTIKSAQEEDLQRAEELTVRTNQLNTTGIHLLLSGAKSAAAIGEPPAFCLYAGRSLRHVWHHWFSAGGKRASVLDSKLVIDVVSCHVSRCRHDHDDSHHESGKSSQCAFTRPFCAKRP